MTGPRSPLGELLDKLSEEGARLARDPTDPVVLAVCDEFARMEGSRDWRSMRDSVYRIGTAIRIHAQAEAAVRVVSELAADADRR